MILLHGEIIETHAEAEYIKGLYEECVVTLNKPNPITAEKVITACDTLYQKAISGAYNDVVLPLLQMSDISYDRFLQMARLFSREELEYKCKVELGEAYFPGKSSFPVEPLKSGIRRKLCPLGILFHIAAGNVDGLPAYSVMEGLLTGNINILKLPAGDNGLSVRLLWELIQVEPDLKDYIYVFDVPSTETETLKQFAEVADAIIVWGGDEALQAARAMAKPNTQIIAWGHKLSFAYVTPEANQQELYRLALHICETNQVLCSSCQGIYLDTESGETLQHFAEKFFGLLQEAAKEVGAADKGMRGRNTIRLYSDSLEADNTDIIHNAGGVSVVVKPDKELELSYLFRNVWVKALPHQELIRTLKKHKNHLQTCGLLCDESQREELAELLVRAGLVRITGSDMSRTVAGEAHDGSYPLRKYSRIVEID